MTRVGRKGGRGRRTSGEGAAAARSRPSRQGSHPTPRRPMRTGRTDEYGLDAAVPSRSRNEVASIPPCSVATNAGASAMSSAAPGPHSPVSIPTASSRRASRSCAPSAPPASSTGAPRPRSTTPESGSPRGREPRAVGRPGQMIGGGTGSGSSGGTGSGCGSGSGVGIGGSGEGGSGMSVGMASRCPPRQNGKQRRGSAERENGYRRVGVHTGSAWRPCPSPSWADSTPARLPGPPRRV